MIPHKYRPDVDGLRALAVVLVLLFHADLGFSGGYVGVDVFFVISGFLITGMILQKQRTGSFEFRTFWLRRIRRILPASIAMVVAVLFAGGFLLLPKDYERLAEATVAQQLMFANIHFFKNTGYFDGPSEMMPLLHTWSLAVEEQFYLLYPCLLVGIGRLRQRFKLATLLTIFVLSFVWNVVTVQRDPSAAFYLLPTRAWEMLLGGLICFAPAPKRVPTWLLGLMSWLGILAIVGSAWSFDSLTPFPGWSALVPCVGTAVLIYANSLGLTQAGRWLAARPVVFVGLISYSLYLWHWPILAFARYWIGEELGPSVGSIALVASFVMAVLSWKFIETPFRRKSSKAPVHQNSAAPRRPFAIALTATVLLVGISQLIDSADGIRGRFSNDVLAILDSSKLPVEYYTGRNNTHDKFPVLGEGSGSDIDFLVWGDSHAMAIGRLADRLAEKHGLTGSIAAAPGTLPLLGVWRSGASAQQASTKEWNETVVKYIRKNRIPNVILVGRWALHLEGRPNGDMKTLVVDDDSTHTGHVEAQNVLRRGFERTLQAIEESGARVWILGQVPLQKGEPTKRLVRSKLFQHTDDSGAQGVTVSDHLDRQTNVLTVISKLRSPHTFIDPVSKFFDECGHSILSDGTSSFYCDNDHISPDGAEFLLSPLLEPVIKEISAFRVAGKANDSPTHR